MSCIRFISVRFATLIPVGMGLVTRLGERRVCLVFVYPRVSGVSAMVSITAMTCGFEVLDVWWKTLCERNPSLWYSDWLT